MKNKIVFLQALIACIAVCPAAFAQNVGIGTNTPAYKLDVTGHINISEYSGYRINKVPVLSGNGSYNIFVGPYAGAGTPPYPVIDGGSMNTMMGYEAGYSNYGGKANTCVGFKSGREASSANHNAFLGHSTGLSNTGSNNTFIGSLSGYNNTFGHSNVFVGKEAGYDNTEGQYNTFVGTQAGTNNETGDYNTFLGYNARPSALLPNLTNSTAIGYNAQVFGSNHVRIGNTNVTSIGGYAGWSDLSDGRFKVNVQEAVQGLAFIKQLRPVTYNLDLAKLDHYLQMDDSLSQTPAFLSARAVKEQQVHSGFIAQEVEQAAKALGFTFSGVDRPQNERDTYKLRYAEFTVPLVKAVQELAADNEALKKELAELKKLVRQLITSD